MLARARQVHWHVGARNHDGSFDPFNHTTLRPLRRTLLSKCVLAPTRLEPLGGQHGGDQTNNPSPQVVDLFCRRSAAKLVRL